MTTNQYGQPIDDKQHVLKTRELIAADVRSLFEKATMSENDGAVDTDLTLFDTDELIRDLAAYVMDYTYKDWSANVRHGVSLGRKDARRMLEALPRTGIINPKTGIRTDYVPATEIQKIITALEETV